MNFVLRFFICVGCIRAFVHTCVFDVDMVSFARVGFDVRKYGNFVLGIQHKDRGTLSFSSSFSLPLFPFSSTAHRRFDGIHLDILFPHPLCSLSHQSLYWEREELCQCVQVIYIHLYPASFALFVPSLVNLLRM